MKTRTTRILARTLTAVCLAIGLLATAPGCEEKKGPAEKAGEKVDEAVQDTKRAIEDATD